MVAIEIDNARLGQLFPAFILIDPQGSIAALGPSLLRHFPGITPGSQLADHFKLDDGFDEARLADLAASGDLLQLVCRTGTLRLSGSVVATGSGYLLAVRHLPSQFALLSETLQMSDFGPDDPIVPGMLLVGLQKAMLEESQANALDLARERQRSINLLDRFSRVAGFMAHDFNNFLSIIRLNADRIAGSPNEGARNGRLARIITEMAERGSEITRSLMTLSRQRYDTRLPIVIDDLIRENYAFLKTIVGTKAQLELALEAPARAVETSRVAVLNCIMNLLINARDAMPDGGTITISTAIRQAALQQAPSPARDHIALVVRDSGVGMEGEVLSRAFEPLFSTKATGNGIGLASVLDFARELGGDACLDSRPGEGATVYMYLPAAPLARDEAPAAPAAAVSSQAMPRVLLVEDEPYALEALAEVLESLDFDVVPCLDAGEARRALAESDFDLLLSDIVLGGESGIDLAHAALADRPALSVILMSGYVPDTEAIPPEWQFIRKPIDSSLLQDMALRVLRPQTRGRPVS